MPAEIVERAAARGLRTGDDHLVDVGHERVREVDRARARAPVIVRLAAAMSPRPRSSAGSSSSRCTGMISTLTLSVLRPSLWLRNVSNSASAS